jgi:hypothetical protein
MWHFETIERQMTARSDDPEPIEGRQFKSWAVMPGGSDIRLDLTTADGATCSVILPFDALSSLLMTLPRMLQAALDQRCVDGSLRVTQPLDNWRLEQPQGQAGLILKLTTPDGFEVAFALNNNLAGSLGRALVTTSSSVDATRAVPIH